MILSSGESSGPILLFFTVFGGILAFLAVVLPFFASQLTVWLLQPPVGAGKKSGGLRRGVVFLLSVLVVAAIPALVALWLTRENPITPTTDTSATPPPGTDGSTAGDTIDVPVPREPPAPPKPKTMQLGGLDFAILEGGKTKFGCDADDCPPGSFLREVEVPPFLIMLTEASAGDYERCVEARRCRAPARLDGEAPGNPQMPVVNIGAADGERFCRELGGRLPTEPEWEFAARGDSVGRVVIGANGPAEVGSLEPNSYGLAGMLGNVEEFVFGPPSSDGTPFLIGRGGSFLSYASDARVFSRRTLDASRVYRSVGFRCAADRSLAP